MTPKEFICTECGDCCKNFNSTNRVLLFPSDIERIADKLELSKEVFLDTFCYVENTKIENQLLDFYYLKDDAGSCSFLVENKCSIHKYKPAQCKHGPYDMFWDGKERWECMEGVAVDKNHTSIELDTKFISEYLKP